jgi:hypothetical protein
VRAARRAEFHDQTTALSRSDKPFAIAPFPQIPTIKRLEANDGPLGGRSGTGGKIRTALERAGVEFIDENGGGAGVRLRKRRQKKVREDRPR